MRQMLTIALAGNPNSGKTTIFNALTGLRQKVANYPGVTVEKKTGRCTLPDGSIAMVIDLPGTYSLISRSIDEHLAAAVLRGLRDDTPAPDVVVVVVDASNLQRNLYLVSQLIEVGRPLVVALNMVDVAERRGINVDPVKLQEMIGAPVVPIVGHKRRGIDELKSVISRACVAPLPDFALPAAMKQELLTVGGGLAILDSKEESKLAHHSSTTRSWICAGDNDRRIDRYTALAERLLIGDRSADVEPIARQEPVASLLKTATNRLAELGIDPMQADVEAHYKWIDEVATGVTGVSPVPSETHGGDARVTLEYSHPQRHLSDKVDAILIHKIWGLLIFAAIMATVFVSLFWLADPLMSAVETLVTHAGRFAAGFLPEGPIHELWTDGIVAGVGAVVVFVPQIALLFMFLAIMEDSGYLARAAFLMDRLLSKVGLHGKSFIPLLSSFACAIPGIMATRTIESRRDRLATIFIAPFMSCSARLPVYGLLIGTFFATFSPAARGGIMLALYALGILAAVITAIGFRLGAKRQLAQTFILEMPSYKVPQASQVLRQVWTNSWAFLAKAGTIIFCLSVILWAMTYYPRLPAQNAQGVEISARQQLENTIELESVLHRQGYTYKAPETAPIVGASADQLGLNPDDVERARKFVADEAVAGAQLRHSIAGRIGHFIEPVIKPLGFDWKMGVGLVGAFAAREVFVSTMGIVYSVGNDDENTEPLASQMLADTYPDGRKVWTPLVAVSLLVWFVIAMQCMSTLAIVKRETGGWKWPMIMLVYMNALAYVMCLGVYQIGRIWFV
ncbi:ferrous iron transport protein B [soil metagenome]